MTAADEARRRVEAFAADLERKGIPVTWTARDDGLRFDVFVGGRHVGELVSPTEVVVDELRLERARAAVAELRAAVRDLRWPSGGPGAPAGSCEEVLDRHLLAVERVVAIVARAAAEAPAGR